MANTPRIVTGPNQDTTGRQITQDYQSPVYTASLALSFAAQRTTIKVGTLSGALSLSADVTAPLIGDELIILFTADGAGPYVVTFAAGFKTTGTLSVAASKFGRGHFVFDGANWVGSVTATV
jgi:hypothetical protein